MCANALCEQCFCQRKSMRNATSCALSNIERLCAAFCETGIETQTVLLKCVRSAVMDAGIFGLLTSVYHRELSVSALAHSVRRESNPCLFQTALLKLVL